MKRRKPRGPMCFQCKHREAKWPKKTNRPRFCSISCAAFYGTILADGWRWCDEHASWWDWKSMEKCPRCKHPPVVYAPASSGPERFTAYTVRALHQKVLERKYGTDNYNMLGR